MFDGGRDPISGKRRQIERTLQAPNNQKGRRLAETELSKLVAEVEARRTAPRGGLTVAQVIDRWILARAPDWSPGQGEATRRRAAQHITPHIGDLPVDKLRPLKKVKRIAAGSRKFTHYRLRAIFHTGGCNWDLLGTSPRSNAKDRITTCPARLAARVRRLAGIVLLDGGIGTLI